MTKPDRLQKARRIQHFLVSEAPDKLSIRQAQHDEGRRAVKLALFLLAVVFLVGPYGPAALRVASVEVYWVATIGLAFSAGVGLYFSSYEKTWVFEPTSITITDFRKSAVRVPIGTSAFAEVIEGPHYQGPGTDRINSFPYELRIHLGAHGMETLAFTTGPAASGFSP
ncbi:MAG: hypothetical protein IPG34_06655 [Rhodocyclaceae bacterium]|nr:hypothetical protein [Rhodocyclaceae bacterium]